MSNISSDVSTPANDVYAMRLAKKVAKAARGNGIDLQLTGHSVGDRMATAPALATGSLAVTFNTVPMSNAQNLLATIGNFSFKNLPTTRHYVTNSDPLGAVRLVRGYLPSGESVVLSLGNRQEGHQLEVLEDGLSVRANSEGQKY